MGIDAGQGRLGAYRAFSTIASLVQVAAISCFGIATFLVALDAI